MANVKDRYLNDPVFHAVVDSLRSIINQARLAPSEVREAAMLACILEEEYRRSAWIATTVREDIK